MITAANQRSKCAAVVTIMFVEIVLKYTDVPYLNMMLQNLRTKNHWTTANITQVSNMFSTVKFAIPKFAMTALVDQIYGTILKELKARMRENLGYWVITKIII